MMVFPSPRSNALTAASVAVNPTGVWRGVIVAVNDDATVDVTVPRLTGEYAYVNVEAIGFPGTLPCSVGDNVYVTFVEGRPDHLLVLGPVRHALTSTTQADSFVFSWPGSSISTTMSGLLPMPRDVVTTEIRFTLYSPGSDDTIIDIYVDEDLVETATIGTGITAYTFPWSLAIAKDSAISLQVTDVGTGASDLVAEVRYS